MTLECDDVQLSKSAKNTVILGTAEKPEVLMALIGIKQTKLVFFPMQDQMRDGT